MTGLVDFSINAADNGTGAAPILWGEGMPANAVNNSAREEMAALARWHSDTNGFLGATISGNAATIVSSQGFKASHFGNGFSISFATMQTNTGPMTLNIDNTGARPWRRPRGVDFAPGDIVPFMIHVVIWSPAQQAYVSIAPTLDEPGRIGTFATSEAIPPGWVECDGRALSRSAYSALFGLFGTYFGNGDGSTTFNIPDVSGRTIFSRDAGKGRLTGAGGIGGVIGSAGGSETVTLNDTQMPSHSHGGSTGSTGAHDHGGVTGQAGTHSHSGTTGGAGSHSHSASSDQQGGHVHTGTVDSAGEHSHQQGYAVGVAGSGSTNRTVSDLSPTGTRTGIGITDSGGAHQHTFTTGNAGAHTHGITINGVGDHTHTIAADGSHAHAINSDGNHSHSLSISSAGGGQAHPNMPPGFVGVFAIKA
ncbi:tail fiber protein [Methylorubrum populi]|uniref:phage tail protein n=1 Tax=Methylorubrum rhodesianum TaxID=29427 RepID=UPI00190BD1B4|nr:phage tail protein [Methylorubrum rhodesianum]MBK3406306.1 tail fiber protein [Methylorubrum rhodesianum]MBY0143200.1 tail fiber protein [Methylorubrum populi]